MIEVTYLTLPGLQGRLNAIDTENTREQFTSILSLVVLPPAGDNDPTAVLVTKTEFPPEETASAELDQAGLFDEDDDVPSEAQAPEFFAAPAAEDDESA